MRLSIPFFLLTTASLGFAEDCGRAVSACVSNINLNNLCPVDATVFPDPCGCSKASQVVQCYSSLCPGQTEVYYANSAYTEVCSGTTVYASGGFIPSSAATPVAGTTGTDTPATATTAATGTGSAALGGVTPAPTGGSESGSGSGSSGSAGGGSAGPASASKAGSERSLILPGGGVMAALLGLAVIL